MDIGLSRFDLKMEFSIRVTSPCAHWVGPVGVDIPPGLKVAGKGRHWIGSGKVGRGTIGG